MIELYSGTPGSGKSLHAASVIRSRLMLGKPVLGNFPVATENIRLPRNPFSKAPRKSPNYIQLHNHYFTKEEKLKPVYEEIYPDGTFGLIPEWLCKFSAEYFGGKPVKEDEILLVIDEAQLVFNARTWDGVGRERWNAFFTQHRKYGYRIIVIAQFDRMLDMQLRSLLEYELVHRKLTNFGWRGWFLSALMLSTHMFVAVKVWYPLQEKVGSDFFRYSRKCASIYDTHATWMLSAET